MKKWKLLYVISIIATLLLFCLINLKEYIRPPFEGWSRSIELTAYEGLDQYSSWKHRYVSVTTDLNEKVNVLLMRDPAAVEESSTPLLVKYAFDGTKKEEHHVKGMAKMPDRTRLVIEEDVLIAITLIDGRIHKMAIGSDGTIVGDVVQAPENVKDVIYRNGHYVFSDEDGFGYIGKKGVKRFSHEIEAMDFLTENGDEAVILRREGGGRVLEVHALDSEKSEPRVIKISGDMMMSFDNLSGYQYGNVKGVIVEIKDTKNAMNTVYHYNIEAGKDFEIARGSQTFSPMIAKGADSEPILLMTSAQEKGQSHSMNVSMVPILDVMAGKEIKPVFLTRTDEMSEAISYGAADGQAWLFSIEKNSRSESVVYSGSNKVLISAASAVSAADIKTVLSSLLFMSLPTLLAGFIPVMNIFIPVFVALALASFFSLERMERNYEKAIRYAVIAHIIMKFYFTYKAILWNDQFADITTVMPFFLNSWITILITLLGTTALSLRIARLRMPVLSKGDCFSYYGSFAFIDLTLYTLLVMPYYYSYLALPIFYS